MADTESSIFEVIKWAYVAIVAPLFGWLGGAFAARRTAKRRKKAIFRELSGLPKEAKAILVDFHNQGTHTLRGDPSAPIMRVLIQRRIIVEGSGGGTYDAVDRYLSITPQVWEEMDDWIRSDISLVGLKESPDLLK